MFPQVLIWVLVILVPKFKIKLVKMMLDTFPKDFSQVATSQRYFQKWKLPICAIFQAAPSQVCPSLSARSLPVLAAALGPLAHPSRSAQPLISACDASEGLT